MNRVVLFIFTMFAYTAANADILDDSKTLCNKIRSCALLEIDQQGLPDETKKLVLGAFDAQCLSAVEKYKTDLNNTELVEKAEACLSSMQNMSCETLMSRMDQDNTESCKEFESAAAKADVTAN